MKHYYPCGADTQGNIGSKRESEFPMVTTWGNGKVWVQPLAGLQAHALSILQILSTSHYRKVKFSMLFWGRTHKRDSWHQCQDLETHRLAGSTHRLCKSVVPKNSGCRIVVLTAMDNHHHREGQGLERQRKRKGWAPRVTHSSLTFVFLYHNICILSSSFSKCHLWIQNLNGSKNHRTLHNGAFNLKRFSVFYFFKCFVFVSLFKKIF